MITTIHYYIIGLHNNVIKPSARLVSRQ